MAKSSENVPKHYGLKAFKLSCFGVCVVLIAELLNWEAEEQQSELMKNFIRSRHALCQFPAPQICQSTARYQEMVMWVPCALLFNMSLPFVRAFLPCTSPTIRENFAA